MFQRYYTIVRIIVAALLHADYASQPCLKIGTRTSKHAIVASRSSPGAMLITTCTATALYMVHVCDNDDEPVGAVHLHEPRLHFVQHRILVKTIGCIFLLSAQGSSACLSLWQYGMLIFEYKSWVLNTGFATLWRITENMIIYTNPNNMGVCERKLDGSLLLCLSFSQLRTGSTPKRLKIAGIVAQLRLFRQKQMSKGVARFSTVPKWRR